MKLKSIKFGGTSLSDVSSIFVCANIIKKAVNKYKSIVTVSAISGITDKMLIIIKYARIFKIKMVSRSLTELSKIHYNILFKIIENKRLFSKIWFNEFYPLLSELDTICKGVTLVGDLTDKTIAEICSFGEKLSSLLMFHALNKLFVNCLIINSEFLIKTNSNFLKANIIISSTTHAIKKVITPLVKNNIVPIITGFVGKDGNGNSTLLGRGASDYTASIVAMVMHAFSVEIWTDVDGIMSADPKIVPNALSWATVDINVMSEMSYSGAKVLHPDTVAMVVKKNIPVFVFNTFNSKFKGTKIIDKAYQSRGLVITYNNTLITCKNIGILNDTEFIYQMTKIVFEQKIPLNVYYTSEISLTFLVKKKDYSKKLLKCFERYGNIFVKNSITKICLIGNNIKNDNKLMADVFAIFKENQVFVQTISVGYLGNNITIMVKNNFDKKMIRELHNKLLETKKYYN